MKRGERLHRKFIFFIPNGPWCIPRSPSPPLHYPDEVVQAAKCPAPPTTPARSSRPLNVPVLSPPRRGRPGRLKRPGSSHYPFRSARARDRQAQVLRRGKQPLVVGHERGDVPLERERGGQVDGV